MLQIPDFKINKELHYNGSLTLDNLTEDLVVTFTFIWRLIGVSIYAPRPHFNNTYYGRVVIEKGLLRRKALITSKPTSNESNNG